MGSLLEAMMLGAILLIALEGNMAVVSASSGFYGHQHHLAQATHVGQALLEDLMLAYDSDPDLAPGAHVAEFDANARRLAGGTYTANWSVTQDAPFPKIRTIAVTLTWLEKGVSRSAQFTTYRN